jgi:predicted nucleic acid-binding protein
MPAAPVILNNTPLVALWTLDQLTLLRELYQRVLIPPAVEAEFLAIDRVARQRALEDASWIEVAPLANPRYALTYTGLDRGEAEVLTLAVEREARLVVIDERKGRRYARHLGLPLTGTLGILLLAKERGVVTAVGPLIERLQAYGLYLTPELVKRVLILAQERDPS